MTLNQARRRLEKLGFEFPEGGKDSKGNRRMGFRYTKEKVNVGLDSFGQKFRTVWISEKNPNFDPRTNVRFLVSGHLQGERRGYRCHKHNTYSSQINYVHGLGTTLEEAVNNFVSDFESKGYLEPKKKGGAKN